MLQRRLIKEGISAYRWLLLILRKSICFHRTKETISIMRTRASSLKISKLKTSISRSNNTVANWSKVELYQKRRNRRITPRWFVEVLTVMRVSFEKGVCRGRVKWLSFEKFCEWHNHSFVSVGPYRSLKHYIKRYRTLKNCLANKFSKTQL